MLLLRSRTTNKTLKRASGSYLLAFLLICWFVLFLLWPKSKYATPRRVSSSLNQDALNLWLKHIDTYPVIVNDRYAFKEHGFRTFVYAEMLRQNQEKVAAKLEADLFKFAPGIRDVRKNVLSGQKTAFGGKLRESYYSLTPRKGIVMVLNAENSIDVLSAISSFRDVLNSTLPVELFHFGGGNYVLDIKAALSSIRNLVIVDLAELTLFNKSYLDHASVIGERRFFEQSLALVASSFSEIVYIEPESVFLEPPEVLFSSPQYQRSGSLFFRDAQQYPRSTGRRILNFLKRQLDQYMPSPTLAESSFWALESDSFVASGVVVLNRQRPGIFAALLYNAWLHAKESRSLVWEVHYRDALKDTLWLSFELTQTPYSLAATAPGSIGRMKQEDPLSTLDPAICNPRPLHFFGRSQGGVISGRPLWLKGPLLYDRKQHGLFRPDSYQPRVKWIPTNGQWCTFGSDPISMDNSLFEERLSRLRDSSMLSLRHYEEITNDA